MVIALKLISLFQAEFGDSKQVFTAVATNKSDAKALISYFILSKCTDIRIDLSQTIPHTTHQFSVDQSSVHQVHAIPQLPSSVTVAQDTPGVPRARRRGEVRAAGGSEAHAQRAADAAPPAAARGGGGGGRGAREDDGGFKSGPSSGGGRSRADGRRSH